MFVLITGGVVATFVVTILGSVISSTGRAESLARTPGAGLGQQRR